MPYIEFKLKWFAKSLLRQLAHTVSVPAPEACRVFLSWQMHILLERSVHLMPFLFSGNAQCLLAGGGVLGALSLLSVLKERRSPPWLCQWGWCPSLPPLWCNVCSAELQVTGTGFFLFIRFGFIFSVCQGRGKSASVRQPRQRVHFIKTHLRFEGWFGCCFSQD